MGLLVIMVLLIEIPAAIVAVIYMRRVLGPSMGLAPFLDRLIRRDTRVAFAGAVIGFLIVYALLRFYFPESVPHIPSPWTSILIGGALIVFLSGPIANAWTVWQERRGSDA